MTAELNFRPDLVFVKLEGSRRIQVLSEAVKGTDHFSQYLLVEVWVELKSQLTLNNIRLSRLVEVLVPNIKLN